MKTLIFVYNAKSDIINSAFDYAHKIISPSTYSCSLCKLTHGNFSEKAVWKEFRSNSADELLFLHSDEFEESYPALTSYPVVLEKIGEERIVSVDTATLTSLKSAEELIELLSRKS